MKLLLTLVTALTIVPCMKGDDLSAFEPILVPVYALQMRGAYESIWSTEFVVHNGTNRPVEFFPAYAGFDGPFTVTLEPGRSDTRILQRVLSANHLGPRVIPKLIFVQRDAAESMSFNLRVRNSKQLLTSWGTEIPVVRLSEFRKRSIRLLNVPLTAGFRTLLRIYSVDHDPSALFTVRGYDMRTNDLLFERTVALEITATSFDPSFADFAEFHVNREIGEMPADLRARLEVEGNKSESRVWAFATITSNSSQIVSTVTPQ